MNKRLTILTIAAATILSAAADDKIVDPDSTGFKFTDIKLVPTTSVKDQNKSGTCWCFAGTSYFEDEIMHNGGDSLDLSEMLTVRYCYLDKARKFLRMQGRGNLAAGGSILDVPYVWARYGAIPESEYAGLNYGEAKHDHSELDGVISGYMNAVISNKKVSTAWEEGLNGILDAYLGKVPETFTVNGKTYTPKSYAESLGLKMEDYIPVTSFTHQPFYTAFGLELADNWLWGQYNNVPLDELKAIVDNAIDNGYSVVWAADVSEKGFKWRKGYAVMPELKSEKDMEGTELSRWVQLSDKDREDEQYDIKGPVTEQKITQESRQQMFDRMETTDDHGMVIIGRAVDQEGNKYYKVKNSWDTNQVYNGYFYVSEPYFLAKTMSILVNRNAIPKDIAKKMKI